MFQPYRERGGVKAMEKEISDVLKRLKAKRVNGEAFSKAEELDYRKLLKQEAEEQLASIEVQLKEAYMAWERAQVYAVEPVETIANYYAKWLDVREAWILAAKRVAERLGYSGLPIIAPARHVVTYAPSTAEWNYDRSENAENCDNEASPSEE